MAARPSATVVIPTYNRAELLRGTLTALAANRPPDEGPFEVVVADDGSTDHTREVVRESGDRLTVRHVFQEDRGFRAAAARNAGARPASAPVLVFLDAGVRPGPDFVRAHLAAHARGRRAVIGYTHGYRPDLSPPDVLAAARRDLAPAEAVRRHGDADALRDVRQPVFERFGYDLADALVPWQWFWSVNCSVNTSDFRAAGGFDEDFRSWGGEDLDLGYRLHRGGTAFTVSRAAWALDTPHERSTGADLASNAANIGMLADKHPEPVTELLWAFFARPADRFEIRHEWNVEDEYRLVLAAAEQARGTDVRAELAPLREVAGDQRVVVLGCGAEPPTGLAAGVRLFDFDGRLAGLSGPGGRVGHALGVRLPFADGSVDRILVTSRLSGLWERWQAHILAEGRRLGAQVDVPFLSRTVR
ncbi:glycosyltransferase [Streptomyces roseirectus]|uniref:Glycosyltransferase n=1 Tax=Streptomyces roseirectus TaxID=2768066 RepID=A0A7H0INM9_9ACTN|nr:glycosyltransferase [Streptomyces roseirectus]QNP74395.1 glycosyltransferase [Streptomyces roseirectus]